MTIADRPRQRSTSNSPETLRVTLRAQAAVVVWFDPAWLYVPGTPDEVDNAVSEFLIQDCRRVKGPDGEPRWSVSDQVRKRTLRSLGPKGARVTLQAASILPSGPVQGSLSRAIDPDGSPDRRGPDTVESLAADLQVARWLGDGFPAAPQVATVEAALAREELLAPLQSFSAAGFYGRERELRRLEEHLATGHRPLVISGIGGVGKSTLLAKFITDRLDGPAGLRFAYLNFDRGALAANQPGQLLAEILRQLSVQVPELKRRAVPLIEDLDAQEKYDEQAVSYSGHESSPTRFTDLTTRLFIQVAKVISPFVQHGLLVMLDTFEEVQRRRHSDLYVLHTFLDQLQDLVPTARIVVSGRALDTGLEKELNAELIVLDELSDTAAMRMILDAPGVNATPELARRTIDLVTRNPLSLRLAIEILRSSHADDPLLDLELQEGQIQGVLYRRILLHIEDPAVRKIAHPGLVVRVVTPDVIRYVLAGPCLIKVTDEEQAYHLFGQLEREATLVTSDGRTLRHRSDVRKLMLPTLQRDQKPQVAKIHRAAIRYYKDLPGPAARAEELYHRLMHHQTVRVLDDHWDDAAMPSLLASMDELPARSQQYLWARSGGEITIPDDVMREADDQAWAAATAPTIADELRAGRPEFALALARERRGPEGESLVPSAEVEALEALRDFDSALAVLRDARDAALRRRRSAEAVGLTLDILRVLERMQHFDEAVHEASELRDALMAGSGESALDYLVATISYLRLLRRTDAHSGASYTEAMAEAVTKAEQLTLRELGSRPGLLRELLAEIGDASEKLLRFGIKQVGVARGRSKRLDSELAKVDATKSEEEMVDDADFESDTAAEPRSRTANKVAEYVNERGMDRDLSAAISESWQIETDDLYS